MEPLPTPVDPDAPRALPANVASALPDLLFGLACLVTWIAPNAIAPGMVRWIVLTMLLEFIVIHSAAFMGTAILAPGRAWPRALGVAGLGAFYSLFVLGAALAFHTWWPLASFWVLTLNRMSTVLLRQAPSGEEGAYLRGSWAAGTATYLLGAMFTVFAPIPRLGITPGVVATLHLPSSGLWIAQPWRPVAFGFLYFTLVGWFELTGFSLFRRATAAARQAGATPARDRAA
jgi:hypothetical protein